MPKLTRVIKTIAKEGREDRLNRAQTYATRKRAKGEYKLKAAEAVAKKKQAQAQLMREKSAIARTRARARAVTAMAASAASASGVNSAQGVWNSVINSNPTPAEGTGEAKSGSGDAGGKSATTKSSQTVTGGGYQ